MIPTIVATPFSTVLNHIVRQVVFGRRLEAVLFELVSLVYTTLEISQISVVHSECIHGL
jgi:hypothetical protein